MHPEIEQYRLAQDEDQLRLLTLFFKILGGIAIAFSLFYIPMFAILPPLMSAPTTSNGKPVPPPPPEFMMMFQLIMGFGMLLMVAIGIGGFLVAGFVQQRRNWSSFSDSPASFAFGPRSEPPSASSP